MVSRESMYTGCIRGNNYKSFTKYNALREKMGQTDDVLRSTEKQKNRTTCKQNDSSELRVY